MTSPFEWSYYIALLGTIAVAPLLYWRNYLHHYRYAVLWVVSLVRGGIQAFLLALGAMFGALAAQVVAPLPPGTAFESGSGVLLVVATVVFGLIGLAVSGQLFRIPVQIMLFDRDASYLKLSYDATEQLLLIAATEAPKKIRATAKSRCQVTIER